MENLRKIPETHSLMFYKQTSLDYRLGASPKNTFLSHFAKFFLLPVLFYMLHATNVKKAFSNIWSVQHPNAGWNIQQLRLIWLPQLPNRSKQFLFLPGRVHRLWLRKKRRYFFDFCRSQKLDPEKTGNDIIAGDGKEWFSIVDLKKFDRENEINGP